MKETEKIYKLSILYLLSKVDTPVSTNKLSFFLLKENYTDYFTLQQNLGELINDGFIISSSIHMKTFFSISSEGRNTLKLLSDELSEDLKKDIEKYIKENKFSIHEDYSVRSKYFQYGLNQYTSTLIVEENGNNILEINISSSTEEAAQKICSNWKKASEDIYPMLISRLLK